MQNLPSPLLLQTFREAYELKNFTATAKKLAMTQSGVSQHIALLEEILGISLFERIGRNVWPTISADKLYTAAGSWLLQMQTFVDDIEQSDTNLAGVVRLGAPSSFGIYILPFLVDWQKRHPKTQIDMEYSPRRIKEAAMLAGKMDLAISGDSFDSRYFKSEKIYRQEFVLVSNPGLKLNLNSWKDFIELPMINYFGSNAVFEKWIYIQYRKSLVSINELNFRFNINNFESMIYLLEQKVGFTIFPKEPLMRFVKEGRLKIHPIGKSVVNTLYIIQRKDQTLSRRVEAVKEVLFEASRKAP